MAFDRRAHVETQDIATNIITANANNICPRLTVAEGISNGITRSATNGIWNFSGTAEATYFYRLIDARTSLPDWWVVGKKYRLYTNIPASSDLRVVLFLFDDKHINGIEFVSIKNGSITFTVPDHYTGVQLRFHINKNGKCGDLSGIIVVLSEIMSNAELEFTLGANGILSSYNSPMISIIDDDGNPQYLSDIIPLAQEKKVPIATAIIGYRIAEAEDGTNPNRSMTWAQIQEAYAAGAEVLSHSVNHWGETSANSRTVGELVEDYTVMKNNMSLHGIDTGDILVYPGASGSSNNAVMAAERVYKCAIRSSGNVPNFFGQADRYNIRRYRIEQEYEFNIELIKPIIDNLLVTGGWMVWMIHTSQNWTADTLSVLSQAIDYIIEKNIPIVSVHYGAKMYLGI